MMAVIFDLDGTLVDSAPDLQAAANRLMRQNDLPELDLATVTCFIGNGMARLVERCFAHHGGLPADLPSQVARFKVFYEEEHHRRTRFMPGAATALRRLAAGGLALGLCTNKDAAPARALLARLGIAHLFAAVLGGDSGLPKKPDPAPLLDCIERCGATPETAVYVGDSETDARTAAAAALRFLVYSEGYRSLPLAALKHEAAFANFAALPQIIAALRAGSARRGPARDAPSLKAIL